MITEVSTMPARREIDIEKTYWTLGEISVVLDLSRSVLKRLEQKFNMPVPYRLGKKRHRRYQRFDVEIFRAIKLLCIEHNDNGVRIRLPLVLTEYRKVFRPGHHDPAQLDTLMKTIIARVHPTRAAA